MRTARGLTLLELLIALALLAALGALVLPSLAGRIAAATADAAAEELAAAAGMARAHALSVGGAVALVAAVSPRAEREGWRGSGDHALWLYADGVSDDALRPEGDDAAPDRAEEALSAGARFLAELPRGCSLGHSLPERGGAGDWAVGEAAAAHGVEETPPIVRLAVFLPDGSPLRPRPVYLGARGGRVFRLDLGPHSGRATVRAVQVSSDARDGADDAEPAPEVSGAESVP